MPGPSTHLVVMGVSGVGKTTIATLIAQRLLWAFAEADDFHPPPNVDKMAAGTPLADDDRWPWLERLRQWMSQQAAEGHDTVLTCSALRRSYRDVLRKADGRVCFVHLTGAPALVADRLARRTDHFMPPALLASQYATLEPLTPDEDGITVPIDAPPPEIADRIVAWLQS